MQKTRLTEKLLNRLNTNPPPKRDDIPDTLVPGLQARVTPKGTISFSVQYRVNGKLKRRTLGQWRRDIVLEDARIQARELLNQRSSDSGYCTLRDLSNDYLEFNKITAPRSWKQTEARLNTHILPLLGDVPLVQVDRLLINKVIDDVLTTRKNDNGNLVGGRQAAKHVKSTLHQCFDWCVDRGHLRANPVAGLRRPDLAPRRDAGHVASEDQLRFHWLAADEMASRGRIFGPIVQMVMLTCCRRGEICNLKWDEVDLKRKVITIPENRYKTGVQHVVPLVDRAMGILYGLPRYDGPYVFSSHIAEGHKPFTGYTRSVDKLRELAQNLYSERTGRKDTLGQFRPFHDFRVTAATKMRQLDVTPLTVELVLGHKPPGIIDTYQKDDGLSDKRAALEKWAKHLGQVVSGNKPMSKAELKAMWATPEARYWASEANIDPELQMEHKEAIERNWPTKVVTRK